MYAQPTWVDAISKPPSDGPATDALYALGANWLKGASIKNIGW